uniref:hypothetical protein n=1 Tax=Paractinoplanes polyasparticus TaxID=2856853 RepID=UPI001C85F1E5|nr:hypothetical protein [Actinoplanes polyasparticus]
MNRPVSAATPGCGAIHVGRLLKSPKSRAGRSWVPLAKPAEEALARYRAGQKVEKDLLGPDHDDHDDHDLIFCRYGGAPLLPDRVTGEFERHVRECDLPVIPLHDALHRVCPLRLAGGVPIEVAQAILGRASPDVTRRVYKHVLRRITAKQVEKVSKLLTRHRFKKPKRSVSNP